MEKEQLKGFVVKKLFHHGYVGGRHTDIENLKKGLPSHIKGEVKEAVTKTRLLVLIHGLKPVALRHSLTLASFRNRNLAP